MTSDVVSAEPEVILCHEKRADRFFVLTNRRQLAVINNFEGEFSNADEEDGKLKLHLQELASSGLLTGNSPEETQKSVEPGDKGAAPPQDENVSYREDEDVTGKASDVSISINFRLKQALFLAEYCVSDATCGESLAQMVYGDISHDGPKRISLSKKNASAGIYDQRQLKLLAGLPVMDLVFNPAPLGLTLALAKSGAMDECPIYLGMARVPFEDIRHPNTLEAWGYGPEKEKGQVKWAERLMTKAKQAWELQELES